jgi:hypothetical protein
MPECISASPLDCMPCLARELQAIFFFESDRQTVGFPYLAQHNKGNRHVQNNAHNIDYC